MASDKVVLEAEIKSNIGEVSKETKELTNNFGAFGITIGGIKDKFKDVSKIMMNGLKQIKFQAQLAGLGLKQMFSGNIRKGAKTLFTVMKTGIAATGIGLLLVAFTSLALFFTKTKKGAELLEVAFKGIGAAVSVIGDRIAKFGGGLAKILSGNVKAGLKDMGDSFKDIGTEILLDVSALILLEKAQQKLIDSQRKLNVETAQQRANIEELKLIAEDVTKSEEERLNAAKKAFKIENDLLNQRVANAEESVRIEQERIDKILDPEAEALDAVAQKEIDLANIRGESATKQVELNNKINAIEAEGAAKRLESSNKRAEKIKEEAALLQEKVDEEKRQIQELIDLETERVNKLTIDAAALLDEFNNSQLEAQYQEQNAIYDKYNAIIEGKIALGESVAELEEAQQSEIFAIDEKYRLKGVDADKKATDKKKALAKSKLDFELGMANQGLQAIASAAGEGTAIAKAAAIAQATMAGTQSVINAFNAANVNVAATAGSFGAYPVTMAALAGTFAAMNIAKIASGGKPGPADAPPPPDTAPPAPQMMSGAFDISGGIAPEALKTYVVTDEMSNSQNQLANIRRRATI